MAYHFTVVYRCAYTHNPPNTVEMPAGLSGKEESEALGLFCTSVLKKRFFRVYSGHQSIRSTRKTMGSYVRHFHRLADYHLWASTRIYNAASALSPTHLTENRGLAFQSVQGTLNHILLADMLWYLRISKEKAIKGTIQEKEYTWTLKSMSPFWNGPESDWTSAIENLEVSRQMQLHQCQRWKKWLSHHLISDRDCEAEFEYPNTRGGIFTQIRGDILDHVFNHGTHHRGQVSAALTQLGEPAPVLDLLYYYNEDS